MTDLLAEGQDFCDLPGTGKAITAKIQSIVMGSYYLARFNHGRGMQLGEVLGQRHGKVVVVGDGVVESHAARTADAMGATVHICSRHQEREAELKEEISPSLNFFLSRSDDIAQNVRDADLVIGAVLLRGAKTSALKVSGPWIRDSPSWARPVACSSWT